MNRKPDGVPLSIDLDRSFDLVAHGQLTQARRQLMSAWATTLFGRYEGEPQEWAEPSWHVFLLSTGQPVCHVSITLRTIRVGGCAVAVAGIGGVMTPREWQGNGFARMAMQQVNDFLISKLKVDFGLLTCFRHLLPMYEKLGWRITRAPYYFEQSKGRQRWLYEVMHYPCRGQPWPPGEIDLRGLPW
jgi:hypothetical protein